MSINPNAAHATTEPTTDQEARRPGETTAQHRERLGLDRICYGCGQDISGFDPFKPIPGHGTCLD